MSCPVLGSGELARVVEVVDHGPGLASVGGLLLKLADVIGIEIEECKSLQRRFAFGTGVLAGETKSAILIDAAVILLAAA